MFQIKRPWHTLDIGEVARQSGLPASTLRYYEEKGLIRSVGRNGLRRLFGMDVLDRLAFITLSRNAGFRLDEIAAMFHPDTNAIDIDRDMLAEKADELDRTIRHLRALRDGLRHAVKCPASNHFDCPSFQRYMAVAVKNQKRRRSKSPSSKRQY